MPSKVAVQNVGGDLNVDTSSEINFRPCISFPFFSFSVEEPIYCEIPSPTKGRTNYPPPLPSRQQNGLRSSWRPKTDAEVVTSSEKQRLPKTNVGLGRRAITQLDMSVAATNRGRPLVTSGRPWQQQPLWKEAIKVR